MPEKEKDNESVLMKRAMSLLYSEMNKKFSEFENKMTDGFAQANDRSYLDPINKQLLSYENKMYKVKKLAKEAWQRAGIIRGAPAASNLTIKSGLNKYYPISILDIIGATVTPISQTEVQITFSSSGPITATTIDSTGNANIATDPNTVNTFGSGAGSNNTIGSSTSTNNIQGTTNLDTFTLLGLRIADLPTGGSIGVATTTVDLYNSIIFNQTTAGQTATIPNPTTGRDVKPFFFSNQGTTAITVLGTSLGSNESMFAIWDNTSNAYFPMKVPITTVTNYTSYDGGTSTGAGTNTYVITAPNKTGVLLAGDQFNFQTNAVGVAGAATLNVNGLGAIQILKSDTSAPDMTQIGAGYNLVVIYNGTDFIIVNYPVATSSGGAGFNREFSTNSVSTTITLLATPSFGLEVYKNGQLLTPVIDYTVAGSTITLVTTPVLTDKFTMTYWTGTSSTYFRENQTGIVGTVITIATPVTGTVTFFKNGQLLTPTDDYTIAGQNITLVVAAITTDNFSIINQ